MSTSLPLSDLDASGVPATVPSRTAVDSPEFSLGSEDNGDVDTHRPKLSPEVQQKLDDTVRQFVDAVMVLDVNSEGFRDKAASLDALGNSQIRAASSSSNSVLDRPMRTMKNGVFVETQTMATQLIELRRQVEALDPSKRGDLFTVRKLLGIIPMGNKLENYFDEYRSAQAHLNGIVKALMRGQDELRRDNAAIETEKEERWTLMKNIEQCIHIGTSVNRELSERLEGLRATDPKKASLVETEMLFYVRQKCIDLLTQQTLNVQGYLILDTARKNNIELIKGVDRATTTLMSALRTAVMACQVLTNQRLVMDQVSALQTTTGNMIVGVSVLMKQQAVTIHEQASTSMVPMEQLKTAFSNIYDTLDAIDDFKVKSLESMNATIQVFSSELDRSQAYLDRVRKDQLGDALTSSTAAPLALNGEPVIGLERPNNA